MAGTVVIVGGGLAGDTAAGLLRENGHDGRIIVLADEVEAPYDRPPLSKDVLTGSLSDERLYLRAASWYEEQNIDLRLGNAVTAIDRGTKAVSLADGSRIDYDTLLLATGAQARMLDAPVDGPPVFVIRTLEDTRRLRPLLVEGARVAIIGAGVIGLEAAASAAMLKCRVSVVELADRVMARIVPPEISHFIADRHRREGVDLHLSAGSVAITPTGVRTATVDIDADLVIVGIGVVPNVGLAEAAGLDCRDGILVDACARTSDPDIFAVGDVARYPDPFGTGDRRCENWKHAQAHALTAVKAILGDPHPYATASSMWSDQYDLKLQTVGRLSGSEISRGEFGGNKFMILYVDAAGVLVGALGINSAKDIRFATTLIEQRRQIDPDLLADPKQDLRKLAA